MKRRFRKVFAGFAVFALVFAQIVTAAYACPQLAEPAAAIAAQPDCHDREAIPNVCERHCDYGKASVDTPKPFASPALVASFAQPLAVLEPHRASPASAPTRVATGPPLTRFTVLRI